MQEKVCIHCFVTGKVQGVWFRVSTQERANDLGLTGWVRNLPDGRVEVKACGEKDKIKLLFDYLKEGPELAEVVDVTYEEVTWEEHKRFATK